VFNLKQDNNRETLKVAGSHVLIFIAEN